MTFQPKHFFCAVLLISKQHERLASFYRDKLGFPLKEESHDDLVKHYGCEIGDLHFAIHPPENFQSHPLGTGSVKLAFEIFNMDEFLQHLKQHDIKPLYPPKNLGGTSLITAIRDPDGNEIEFTQLSAEWFDHLKKNRAKGCDVIAEWNKRQ